MRDLCGYVGVLRRRIVVNMQPRRAKFSLAAHDQLLFVKARIVRDDAICKRQNRRA